MNEVFLSAIEGLENVGRFWDMGAWEMAFLLWLNSLHGTFIDYVFLIITFLGDKGIVWITSGVVMLFFKKTRRMGIYVITTYALIGGTNNFIIKLLTDRSRPFYDNTIAIYPAAQSLQDFAVSIFYGDGIILGFAEIPDSTSFFSGHTVASIACAMMMFMHNKKFGIPALILASIIAFSRLWLGVHWPTDVIFGVIFAIGAAIGLYYLLRFIEPKVLKLVAKLFNKDKTAEANPE